MSSRSPSRPISVASSRGGGPPGRGGGGGGRGGGRGRGRGRGGRRGLMHRREGGPREEPDVRRDLTRRIDETKERFDAMGINEGDTVMAEKKEPGTSYLRKVNIDTNVYGVKLQPIPVYRYDITIDGTVKLRDKTYHRDFTKRTKDDCVVVDRKNRCRRVFIKIMEKYPNLCQGDRTRVYYDLQSILWTLEQLELKGEKGERDEFVLEAADLEGIEEFKDFSQIRFEVKKVKKDREFTLDDLSSVTRDPTTIDHSLQQFLELATSQIAFFEPQNFVTFQGGQTFLMNHQEHGFTEDDAPPLSNDKYLAIGASKSIRYIEGPKGRGRKHAALVVETKKSAFHTDNIPLTEKVQSLFPYFSPTVQLRQADFGYLNNMLKGITVEIRYRGTPKQFKISGISTETANSKTYPVNQRQVSITDYFAESHNIRLNFPYAPLVATLESGGLYPMELCYVVENQRVTKQHMTREEDNRMIRACAVEPAKLKNQNERIADALHLKGVDNPYLANAQIGITSKTLKPPAICYDQGSMNTAEVNEISAKWNAGKHYIRPANAPIWAAYYILSDSTEKFSDNQFKDFLKAYIRECRRRGIQLDNPKDYRRLLNNRKAVHEQIEIASDNQVRFIFFITSKMITELHKWIKLCEREFQVVTQDMKLNNAQDIIGGRRPETLQNIVNKTNMKLGGLNYSIIITEPSVKDMFGHETLFLGLGMSHPGAVGEYEKPRGTSLQYSPPSVIGYAANILQHPFEFVGDCVFGAPRRDEKMDVIATLIKQCIKRFRENRRGNIPRRLIVYRNGTSEGQFPLILRFEVPLMKHALAEEGCTDVGITLIVPQRSHNIKPGKAPDVNIKPGTVVDTGIVHPEYCEFYLNSHQAIQGTVKTPKYTVLVDDNNLSLDTIEGMTHMLTFGHQIVNLPVSLPAPVYIAGQYAERGRALFSEYKKEFRGNAQKFGLEIVTNRLSYAGTELSDRRVNA